MNRKSILIILTRLNNGGAAKCAVWLSGLLDKKEFSTILVSGKTEGNEDEILWYPRQYSVSPVIVSQMRRRINPILDLIALFRIFWLILKVKPDIVHTHMSKAGLLGRTAAVVYNLFHRTKVKIIHTFHGHVFHSYFSGMKTRLFTSLEKLLARKTDFIICLSKRLENEILQSVNIKKSGQSVIVPLGVDYSPSQKAGDGNLGKKRLSIGMLSRLAPIKNYPLAMEIGGILSREGIPADILIGGGGSRKDVEKLQKSIPGNISLLGNIRDSGEFWEKNDIALVTSLNEGTPVSLIEAMMSGIPFIAPAVGGIPDMVLGPLNRKGHLLIYGNCILVKGFDPEDFVTAIRLYMDGEFRKRAGCLAGQYASQNHGINKMIKRMEMVYNEVLEK